MAATREQLEQLRAKMLDTPPEGVPFRQVIIGDRVGYIPFDEAELAQRQIDEAKHLARVNEPRSSSLAQKVADLEARLKALGG